MAELNEMTQEELVKEIEGAREQIKRVNSESAGRRKQLEAFEKKLTLEEISPGEPKE